MLLDIGFILDHPDFDLVECARRINGGRRKLPLFAYVEDLSITYGVASTVTPP